MSMITPFIICAMLCLVCDQGVNVDSVYLVPLQISNTWRPRSPQKYCIAEKMHRVDFLIRTFGIKSNYIIHPFDVMSLLDLK